MILNHFSLHSQDMLFCFGDARFKFSETLGQKLIIKLLKEPGRAGILHGKKHHASGVPRTGSGMGACCPGADNVGGH